MYSQMHQPDVLVLVKESLSVSRESPLFYVPQQERRKPDCYRNLKFVSFFDPQLSSLIWKLIFMPGCLWSFAKRKRGDDLTFI